ncbi:hypothetical protein P175DRAFT_0533882 [Aspergillus ochraceoroseus IBT 24754]|uniref:Uncharacterized protein n=1 Tax=Aspergillus ochraceoroseus IBT 24754 TaxID=1392256 RepID=A0A2T5LT42_9EURO|nr:uncharacterized protein P175DRAFT_0533882 [Aspergillus ochraceoroseus IBT 24754]PTU19445.1 hypothetical protein P175DRAFT_0533882 [Aspergillus ochraceoroseus IBT 24754]
MNMQAVRAQMRTREVSERKQVGDAESLLNVENSRRLPPVVCPILKVLEVAVSQYTPAEGGHHTRPACRAFDAKVHIQPTILGHFWLFSAIRPSKMLRHSIGFRRHCINDRDWKAVSYVLFMTWSARYPFGNILRDAEAHLWRFR